MRSNTKLAKIRNAIQQDDWEKAIRIASTFTRLGENKEIIKRASESLVNPEFYEQMGYDLDKIKEEAINAIKTRFSKSWDEVKTKKK